MATTARTMWPRIPLSDHARLPGAAGARAMDARPQGEPLRTTTPCNGLRDHGFTSRPMAPSWTGDRALEQFAQRACGQRGPPSAGYAIGEALCTPAPSVPMAEPEGGGDRNAIPLYRLPNRHIVNNFSPTMPLRILGHAFAGRPYECVCYRDIHGRPRPRGRHGISGSSAVAPHRRFPACPECDQLRGTSSKTGLDGPRKPGTGDRFRVRPSTRT